jgi:putative polyketide hydroxylase
LIAADGANSSIRDALEIPRSGRGYLRTVRSVLFRAPLLEDYLKTGVHQFEIEQPQFKAFLTTYNDGRWVLMFTDDVDRDSETLRRLIVKAIGRSDVPFEILTTGRWELTALIADKFAVDRVFLTGDAAHALPPTRGGFGANTGIADAHNLAWKLASVLRGTSTPALLETYDAERRPVAWRRHQQIFARPDYMADADGVADDETIIDDDAMEFGQLYRSSAVIGTETSLPPALRPDEWRGQPGTRAPHLWITRGDERVSTLDLFESHWTLLAASERWRATAKCAAMALGIELVCFVFASDLASSDGDALRTAFGLGRTGASLIRPDGFVAWRTADAPTNPALHFSEALAAVASKVQQNTTAP